MDAEVRVGALDLGPDVLSGMPYRRFLPWNVAASLAWASVVVSLGYLFGRNVKSLVSDLSLVIAGVIVVGAIAVWVIVRRRRRREAATGG